MLSVVIKSQVRIKVTARKNDSDTETEKFILYERYSQAAVLHVASLYWWETLTLLPHNKSDLLIRQCSGNMSQATINGLILLGTREEVPTRMAWQRYDSIRLIKSVGTGFNLYHFKCSND